MKSKYDFFAFSNGSIIPPSAIVNHHAVVDAINDDDGILSFTVAIDHDVAEDALALNDLLQLNIFLLLATVVSFPQAILSSIMLLLMQMLLPSRQSVD